MIRFKGWFCLNKRRMAKKKGSYTPAKNQQDKKA